MTGKTKKTMARTSYPARLSVVLPPRSTKHRLIIQETLIPKTVLITGAGSGIGHDAAVQLDPAADVKRYVELVEADKTELVNFIPKDILERLGKR